MSDFGDLAINATGLIGIAFIVAASSVLAAGRIAMPPAARVQFTPARSPGRLLADRALSLIVIAYVFALYFAISWRPIYSCLGTISFFAVFACISRAKYNFIREPLIFTDLVLVRDVLKYKEIFYATWINKAFWVAAFLYVFGGSAMVMWLEPSLLPDSGALAAYGAGLVAWMLPLALLLWRPVRVLACKLTRLAVGSHELRGNIIRFGTFQYIALNFLMWFGTVRVAFVDDLDDALHRLLDAKNRAPPLIVVWQSESFLDIRRLGLDSVSLPQVDALRRRAARWGLLRNVFEGGYTMRTEFSVLSGLRPEAIGLDSSYPYLRAQAYRDVAWPMRLRKAGWHTHFVHPYDRTFFRRHRAIPELGFSQMTMLDDFQHTASPQTPYVTDLALAERVTDICKNESSTGPTFLFVASMGNHGPWQEGRVAGSAGPVDTYCRLLEEADAALGLLVRELDDTAATRMAAFLRRPCAIAEGFCRPVSGCQDRLRHRAAGNRVARRPVRRLPGRHQLLESHRALGARRRTSDFGRAKSAERGTRPPRSADDMTQCETKRTGVRSFLFLQGSSSPLFKKIGARLAVLGHEVTRINICAGDWVFWHGPSTVNYRGRLDDWPGFVEEKIKQRGITDVVLLGDERPHHKAAAEVCRRRGIQVYVVEMGYLRPDWLTLERGGISTKSHFPNDPHQIVASAAGLPAPDFQQKFAQHFWVEALCDLAYNLPNLFFWFLYPHYRPHSIHHPLAEYAGWLRKLVTARGTRRQAAKTLDEVLGLEAPYFLFPLQLQTDYQIRAHSPFAEQRQALEHLFRAFSDAAPGGCHLVVKVHPLDNGLVDWRKLCRRLAAQFGLSQRIHYLAAGDLDVILNHAQGVVTINSTVGIHALLAGLPVKVLGTALFDIKGLTDQQSLQGFFQQPAAPRPEIRDAFMRLLAATIQVRGNLYSREGSSAGARAIAERLDKRLVNQPGAFVLVPPRQAEVQNSISAGSELMRDGTRC